MKSNIISSTLLVEIQNNTATVKISFAASGKVNHTLTLWPNNFTDRYSPKKNETHVHTRYVHQCLYLIYLLTVQNWKQPKCPSRIESINNLWCIILLSNIKWKNYFYTKIYKWVSKSWYWARKVKYIYHLCEILVKAKLVKAKLQ